MICALAIAAALLLRLYRPSRIERPGAGMVAAWLDERSWVRDQLAGRREISRRGHLLREALAQQERSAIHALQAGLYQPAGARPADPATVWWPRPAVRRVPPMGQPIPDLAGAA